MFVFFNFGILGIYLSFFNLVLVLFRYIIWFLICKDFLSSLDMVFSLLLNFVCF